MSVILAERPSIQSKSSLAPVRFGANVQADGRTAFGFWAPTQETISIRIEGRSQTLPMQKQAGGWFSLVTDQARAGDRYTFVLADGQAVPDPASRFQPQDAAGPSEIIDPTAFRWTDAAWKGRPWEECILYELHVGSFTAAGTYRGAIEKLDHLVELGVTAIELMPLADFPGDRNWGYDGVMLYAPDGSYGRPDDLRALVDAAHARGLMVFLDVVYNHFGPEGNYLGGYAPQLFSEKHKTPWGSAINYGEEGSEAVRELVIGNACYWISEFHFDGLRLDAVHAIVDESEKHVLEELAERVRATAGPGRHVHLVLENDLNQPRFLERNEDGSVKWYNAQWNDDFHHCLHAAATKETFGYYCAYTDCYDLTARALAEGFAYQGEVTPFTHQPRGEISSYLPPTAFVSFIQNHDQIGNRPMGERITDICPPEAARAISVIYLLAPQIPLVFMGEEWRAEQPFQYFCGFEGELADSIRKGRREEFKEAPGFDDPSKRDTIPDPTDPATFAASKLDWDDLRDSGHAEWLEWYRKLLAVRSAEIVPLLFGAKGCAGNYDVSDSNCIEVSYELGGGKRLKMIANLQAQPADRTGSTKGRVIWTEGSEIENRLAPWTVIWSLE